MPFTFAHPAIILPLGLHKRLSITALIIGSIIPDFEFFISLNDKSVYAHTWAGMFYFDLPLAFAMAYLYHNLLKIELSRNLPAFISGRIDVFNSFNWNAHVKQHFFPVLLSFLLGISSHLLLDMFTHYDVTMFKRFPWMLYPIRFSETYVIGLFVLLWYISSLVGILIVGYVFFRLPKHHNPSKISTNFWLLTITISILVLIVRNILLPQYENIPEVLIVLLGSFMWGLVLTTVLRRIYPALKQTS